jgi:hypothetical protein
MKSTDNAERPAVTLPISFHDCVSPRAAHHLFYTTHWAAHHRREADAAFIALQIKSK